MKLAHLYQKKTKVFNDGETIVSQGEMGSHIFIVKSGAVEVVREFAGEEIKLAIIDQGDFFGEMALFEYLPRSATVKAKGRTELYVLMRDDLLDSIKDFPEIAFDLLATMSKRLRKTDNEIEKLLKLDKITKEMLKRCLSAQGLI